MVDRFAALFVRPPDLTAEAPGRVNLIGEHTDYNGGFVLPLVIPLRATVSLARRHDTIVRVASANLGGETREYRLGSERPRGEWIDYVAGVTRELRESGRELGGFDALISSTVPIGAGLASSAAMEVALLRALRAAFELELDDVALAHTGHRAENDFVGARVGMMDQLAASLGQEGEALFVDTRTLERERLTLSGAELAVLHSGLEHGHATGEYNARRRECEEAARLLGVPQLRDIAETELARVARLPAPLDRRARHVVTENARVLAAVRSMRAADMATLGRIFLESHRSMRDEYQVSTEQIDALVELARARADVFGARLTGGGFGGCVIVLARAGRAAEVGGALVDEYRRRTGAPGRLLLPAADDSTAR